MNAHISNEESFISTVNELKKKQQECSSISSAADRCSLAFTKAEDQIVSVQQTTDNFQYSKRHPTRDFLLLILCGVFTFGGILALITFLFQVR